MNFMNQMRPATKRDNLYTLSFFALKLWIFKLKLIPRVTLLKLAKALPPGPCPGLTRRANAPQLPGGRGLWAQVKLIDCEQSHFGQSRLSSAGLERGNSRERRKRECEASESRGEAEGEGASVQFPSRSIRSLQSCQT